jgi:hypothetical protein
MIIGKKNELELIQQASTLVICASTPRVYCTRETEIETKETQGKNQGHRDVVTNRQYSAKLVTWKNGRIKPNRSK